MECLTLEGTAIIMSFLQISVVPIGRALVSKTMLPSWKAVEPKLSCLCPPEHTQLWYPSSFCPLAPSLHQRPCFSLWTCFILVYLAVTLGFPRRTLAWLWTESSSEHPECDGFLWICFSGSNMLDQQQAVLTGQRIQLIVLRDGCVHQGSMRSFELMQNHFP